MAPEKPLRLARLPEVLRLTGLSRSSLFALVQARKFPSQIKLSERSSAWVCSEVEQWIIDRIKNSRQP